jgi:restriction system protein
VRPAPPIAGALYSGAIAQLTLLCLKTIFDADSEQHIDVLVLNGVVDTKDPRSGQPIRPCLITVRVTRDTYNDLDLAHVDPQACLKHLSAGVSRSPTELAPVRPVLEFSMVDPRFIAETDAIGALDERPNLLELKFTEFESLT